MIRQLRAHGDCPKAYQLAFQRMKPEGLRNRIALVYKPYHLIHYK
jgi:hypothetical protein